MLVIGLTGGIGSGKTTVANLFAQHGAPIIDADIIAHDLTQPDMPAYKKIVDHFGNQYPIEKEHSLDRLLLRKIIFEHSHEREWLEGLLHPLILACIEKAISLISAPYCIVVIPLLFEIKPYSFIKRILVVDTPEQVQIDRIIKRDKLSDLQIKAIIHTQTTREIRLKGADDIILNNNDLAYLSKEVTRLHQLYMNLGTQ